MACSEVRILSMLMGSFPGGSKVYDWTVGWWDVAMVSHKRMVWEMNRVIMVDER